MHCGQTFLDKQKETIVEKWLACFETRKSSKKVDINFFSNFNLKSSKKVNFFLYLASLKITAKFAI